MKSFVLLLTSLSSFAATITIQPNEQIGAIFTVTQNDYIDKPSFGSFEFDFPVFSYFTGSISNTALPNIYSFAESETSGRYRVTPEDAPGSVPWIIQYFAILPRDVGDYHLTVYNLGQTALAIDLNGRLTQNPEPASFIFVLSGFLVAGLCNYLLTAYSKRK